MNEGLYLCTMKFKSVSLEEINRYSKNTLMGVLGIECVEIGEDYIVATMPVDQRTRAR